MAVMPGATGHQKKDIKMMDSKNNATVERIDGRDAGPGVRPAMLTVHDVGQMLNCSARTVYRLTDSGRMPRPVKLGALVRWPREMVTRWVAAGCPSCREGRKGVTS